MSGLFPTRLSPGAMKSFFDKYSSIDKTILNHGYTPDYVKDDMAYLYHKAAQDGVINVPEFSNDQRRSGRSSIIITKAILKLLTTGSVLVTDHWHDNHTMSYYQSFVLRYMINGIMAITGMDRFKFDETFEYRYDYYEGLCIGIRFKSKTFNPIL